MSNIPTVTWSETSPTASSVMGLGDDRIRELKTQLREVFAVDHEMGSSGQDTDWGYHKVVKLIVQSAKPAAIASTGQAYQREISDINELHYEDENGTETQITSNGTILVGDDAIATSQIQDDAVTTAKIAEGAVTTTEILDATIATADIADDAVTADILADAVVVLGHMAASSGIPQIVNGTYEGDGNDDRTINAGIDLSSGSWIVIVARLDGTSFWMATNNMDAGYSKKFGDGTYNTDRIQGGAATGFIVGTNNDVNASSGEQTYIYVAIKIA